MVRLFVCLYVQLRPTILLIFSLDVKLLSELTFWFKHCIDWLRWRSCNLETCSNVNRNILFVFKYLITNLNLIVDAMFRSVCKNVFFLIQHCSECHRFKGF